MSPANVTLTELMPSLTVPNVIGDRLGVTLKDLRDLAAAAGAPTTFADVARTGRTHLGAACEAQRCIGCGASHQLEQLG